MTNPPSRGSTASARSTTTPCSIDQSLGNNGDEYNPQQWLPNGHGQHRELAPAPQPQQMTSQDMEDMNMLQLQTVHDAPMEPPTNNVPMGQSMPFHPQSQSQRSRHSLPTDQHSANNSFADMDSQMMDTDGHVGNDSSFAIPREPTKAARSSANNEVEMRNLFRQNENRNLQDVAEELHGNERGPSSERTRQIFAMLWISRSCVKREGTSVPRGRVYHKYATRCSTERINVLNPASFGKLVRVLFPGLNTRRLGVRGESKYHYVNFAFKDGDDELDIEESTSQPQLPFASGHVGHSLLENFNTVPRASTSARTEKQFRPSPEPPQPVEVPIHRFSGSRHAVYIHPETTSKITRCLYFPQPDSKLFDPNSSLELPSIVPFLPDGTDIDAAKSLEACYRSHCTALSEAIRYCKETSFFYCFTSFQGTLTVPVQKLFSNPTIAPWIEECDFVMYQRMMRILHNLKLSVIPRMVLTILHNIADSLVVKMQDGFRNQPPHVIRAKEAPAALFASLLDRLLRVNTTAHSAANTLSNPANREQMYKEWMEIVRVRKAAECVPARGMDDVVELLRTGFRDVLAPSDEDVSPSSNNNATPLDRWVTLLRSLPDRFPYASPDDIVQCVHNVGTSALSDITIAQGQSFTTWHQTKIWIDEMISLMAEEGGFLNRRTTQQTILTEKRQAMTGNVSRRGSRLSSASGTTNLVDMGRSQSEYAPAPQVAASTELENVHPEHDDSAIGLEKSDDDFNIDKYTYAQAEGHGLPQTIAI